jgi:hypothetical protein
MTSHYSLNPKQIQRAVDQLQAITETYMAHLKKEASVRLSQNKWTLLNEINDILKNSDITPECKLATLFLAEDSGAIFNDIEKMRILSEGSQRSFVSSQFWKIINDVLKRCGFPKAAMDITGRAQTKSMFDSYIENSAGMAWNKTRANKR